MAGSVADYLRWKPDFCSVMDGRFYTELWLDNQVLSGVYRLFCNDDAAILAELKAYPTGALKVEGVVAAGDMATIVQALIPQAEAWGIENGAISARIESREGWARALKPYGYEIQQVAIEKDLPRCLTIGG